MATRIRWIDHLKGITILLVVIGHTIGGYISSGVFEGQERVYQFVYDFIYSFHMPLAMLLSGYVFFVAYFGNHKADSRRIATHALDLFVLYIAASFLIVGIKLFALHSVNNAVSLKDILLIPFRAIDGTGLWYLYTLAELYVIAIAYNKFRNRLRINAYVGLAVLFCVSCLATLVSSIRILELGRILKYAFFFALGIWLAESRWIPNAVISVILLATGIIMSILMLVYEFNNPVAEALTSVLISVGLFTTIARTRKNSGGSIGLYMTEIYILHLIIVPAVRIVATKVLPHNLNINVIITSVLGVVIPIIFGMVLRKLGLYKHIFSPVSSRLRRRKNEV